jgi:hypothetical protein
MVWTVWSRSHRWNPKPIQTEPANEETLISFLIDGIVKYRSRLGVLFTLLNLLTHNGDGMNQEIINWWTIDTIIQNLAWLQQQLTLISEALALTGIPVRLFGFDSLWISNYWHAWPLWWRSWWSCPSLVIKHNRFNPLTISRIAQMCLNDTMDRTSGSLEQNLQIPLVCLEK